MIGTSQCDLLLSRKTASSSGEYHCSPVAGLTGSIAPGMSFHRKCWNVRTAAVSIGYLL